MEKLDIAETFATARLAQAGFRDSSLDSLQLPMLQLAETPDGRRVPYEVFGDLDAKQLAFVVSPYGCRVNDASQGVRLQAQQIALGEEACVVGLHVYEPGVFGLSRQERNQIARGSFRPYADRVLTVIEALKPNDDQEIILYGFSKGADVSIETAFQVATNPHRGIRSVERLGAIEPARTQKRGAFAMVRAFQTSGDDLYDNVLAAKSPALLEARGIDLSDAHARKKHDKQVVADVVRGNLRDIRGNIANIRGFATDESLMQLNMMIEMGILPRTVVGRMTNSPICISDFMKAISPSDNLTTFEVPGDHSLADNVRKSAAFIVRAVVL